MCENNMLRKHLFGAKICVCKEFPWMCLDVIAHIEGNMSCVCLLKHFEVSVHHPVFQTVSLHLHPKILQLSLLNFFPPLRSQM